MSGYSANFDLCIFDVILIEDGTVEELYMSEKILGMLAGSVIESHPPTPETTTPKLPLQGRRRRNNPPYSQDPFPTQTTTTTRTIYLGCGGKIPHLDNGRIDSGR